MVLDRLICGLETMARLVQVYANKSSLMSDRIIRIAGRIATFATKP